MTLRRLLLLRGPSMMMVILLGLQSTVLSAAFAGSTATVNLGVGGQLHRRPGRWNENVMKPKGLIQQRKQEAPGLRGGADAAAATGAEINSSDEKSSSQSALRRELLAELIGTFLIVQLGTGSVMSAIYTDSLVGLFQIASVWIIAVTVAICTTASISGAHLNPAISVCWFV